ncbi:MAG TPA: hypothetical protein VHP58_01755 [Alphaproteobacteria bacterium]|nr:hypothetical protein [Alphaproteobacteria bacterium]
MWQLLGAFILIMILGSLVDTGYYGTGPNYRAHYTTFQTDRSPTGYAVTRRYYDLQTGDTYAATTPVQVAYVDTRRPRGTINYGGYSIPPMGIQPRSY